jgi:hypothetical protein
MPSGKCCGREARGRNDLQFRGGGAGEFAGDGEHGLQRCYNLSLDSDKWWVTVGMVCRATSGRSVLPPSGDEPEPMQMLAAIERD